MVKVLLQKSMWSPNVQVLLRDIVGGGYGKHIAFEKLPDGQIIDPTFSISEEEAQGLVDQLWTLGFRPSEGSGSAGALAATQKHLEDMRKIAFDQLEKHAK